MKMIARPDPRTLVGAYAHDGIRLYRALVDLHDGRIAYEDCRHPQADCIVLKLAEIQKHLTLVKAAPD